MKIEGIAIQLRAFEVATLPLATVSGHRPTGRASGTRLDCVVWKTPGLNALGANGAHSKAPFANNV